MRLHCQRRQTEETRRKCLPAQCQHLYNNVSAISWRPVLVVEEAGVPADNRCVDHGQATGKLYHFTGVGSSINNKV